MGGENIRDMYPLWELAVYKELIEQIREVLRLEHYPSEVLLDEIKLLIFQAVGEEE